MKKLLISITAALLLTLPAACMHHGYRGGPGGPGCQKHKDSECKCHQRQDCPKPDCPSKPDCPQTRHQEPPPPAK